MLLIVLGFQSDHFQKPNPRSPCRAQASASQTIQINVRQLCSYKNALFLPLFGLTFEELLLNEDLVILLLSLPQLSVLHLFLLKKLCVRTAIVPESFNLYRLVLLLAPVYLGYEVFEFEVIKHLFLVPFTDLKRQIPSLVLTVDVSYSSTSER